jgi:hypothetical protein
MALNKLLVKEIIPLIWVRVSSVVISIAMFLNRGLDMFISEDLKKKEIVMMMMPCGKEMEIRNGIEIN